MPVRINYQLNQRKLTLEKDGRIISGFNIDRKWNSTDLQLHLASLLMCELIGLSFEIVKNSSGTVVRLNIPLGKEIGCKTPSEVYCTQWLCLYKTVGKTGKQHQFI